MGTLNHPAAVSAVGCRALLKADDFTGFRNGLKPTRIVKRVKVIQGCSGQRLVSRAPSRGDVASQVHQNTNAYTKSIGFVDSFSSHRTTLAWPRLRKPLDNDKFEATGPISRLARNIIRYLNELGLTNSTLVTNDTKLPTATCLQSRYSCEVKFALENAHEKFLVELNLAFHLVPTEHPRHPSLYVSGEQLSNYLKDKLVFRHATHCSAADFKTLEKKIQSTMRLVELTCYVNGLQLEL